MRYKGPLFNSPVDVYRGGQNNWVEKAGQNNWVNKKGQNNWVDGRWLRGECKKRSHKKKLQKFEI